MFSFSPIHLPLTAFCPHLYSPLGQNCRQKHVSSAFKAGLHDPSYPVQWMTHLPMDISGNGGRQRMAWHGTVWPTEVPSGRHRDQPRETSCRSVRKQGVSGPLEGQEKRWEILSLTEKAKRKMMDKDGRQSLPSMAGITVLRSASTSPRGEPNKKKPDTLNSSFPTTLVPSKFSIIDELLP